MKFFLSLALFLTLLDAPSWSQTQTGLPVGAEPTSNLPKFEQSDLKEAQELLRVDRLWNKPLDWKEKGASTADIVAHLRQLLGKDTGIEVRSKDGNLSTFELPQTPLGPTLSSVAGLANAKLWAFPSRLLIAPENLLTPEENALVKARLGGEWKEGSSGGGTRWSALDRYQLVALSLVGDDLKERFAAKGLTPVKPAPPVTVPQEGPRPGTSTFVTRGPYVEPPPAYELPLSDLSPATKEILQSLLSVQWQPTRPSMTQPPALEDSMIVGFDDTRGSQIQLLLQQTEAQDATKRNTIGRWYASKPQPSL